MGIHELPDRLIGKIRAETRRLTGGEPGSSVVGVAVSGGADSVFLLAALMAAGHQVDAASVDHALRAGSRGEAEGVGAACRAWGGVPHEVLTWERGEGFKLANLQADARDARYRLLAEWARRRGIGAVALGHNLDDAAENFVMRGVGMSPLRIFEGVTFFRPMLSIGREEVRRALRDANVPWADDPSNENERFRRVAVRRVLGADPDARSAVISAMRRGQVESVGSVSLAAEALRRCMRVDPAGRVLLSPSLRQEDPPVVREALRAVLRAVGEPDGRMRGPRLARAAEEFAAGRPFTLCGALHDPRACAFTRDPGRAEATLIRYEGVWDGRWAVRTDGEVMVGAHRKGGATVPRAADGRLLDAEFLLTMEDVLSRLAEGPAADDQGPVISLGP